METPQEVKGTWIGVRKVGLGFKMDMSTLTLIFVAVLLIPGEGLARSGSSSLRCHKCISLFCPESSLFCDRVKDFVTEQLADIYTSYGPGVKNCPDPLGEESVEAWKALGTASSHCPDDITTCALGRFQVKTFVLDLNKNITSYGTALGCAKQKLLAFVNKATKQGECSMVDGQSGLKESLKHYLNIEHCYRASQICGIRDFCINPNSSVALPFRDPEFENAQRSSFSVISIILIVFLVIGLLVGFLTFLGMKYD